MEPSSSTFGGVCHSEAVNYKYLDSKRAICINDNACYVYQIVLACNTIRKVFQTLRKICKHFYSLNLKWMHTVLFNRINNISGQYQ